MWFSSILVSQENHPSNPQGPWHLVHVLRVKEVKGNPFSVPRWIKISRCSWAISSSASSRDPKSPKNPHPATSNEKFPPVFPIRFPWQISTRGQGSSHNQRLRTSHHPRRCMRCRRTTRTPHQKPLAELDWAAASWPSILSRPMYR